MEKGGALQAPGTSAVAVANATDSINMEKTFSVPHLPLSAPEGSVDTKDDKWTHMSNIPPTETKSRAVNVLIGCDVSEAHYSLEQRPSGSMTQRVLLVDEIRFMQDKELHYCVTTKSVQPLDDRTDVISAFTLPADGHLEVPMTWKVSKFELPNSYATLFASCSADSVMAKSRPLTNSKMSWKVLQWERDLRHRAPSVKEALDELTLIRVLGSNHGDM
ncbi:unnamed protein product [Echinostoma caproni]|uniref:BRCA-2_OB1 domain-containing protein n=1 Tax=Echinostoma caproni TaxID=27848 RepID=A0A183ADY6_9TREM|nr:unnamed protein product [Echinostoma caproni]